MDIRSYFFRNSGKSENSLKQSLKTPDSKKIQKIQQNDAEAKKNNSKRKTPADKFSKNSTKDDVVISDSDLEDPVPSKLRKTATIKDTPEKSPSKCKPSTSSKPARKNRIIYSDSDEDLPVKQKETTKKPDFTKLTTKNPTKPSTVPPKITEKSKNQKEKLKNDPKDMDVCDILIDESDDDVEDFVEITDHRSKPLTKKTKLSSSPQRQKGGKSSRKHLVEQSLPIHGEKSRKVQPNFSKNGDAVDNKKRVGKPDKKEPAPVPRLNPISVTEFFNGAKAKDGKKHQQQTSSTSPAKITKIREREDHGDSDFNKVLDEAAVDMLSPCTITSTVSGSTLLSRSTTAIDNNSSSRRKEPEKSPVRRKQEIKESPKKRQLHRTTPKKRDSVESTAKTASSIFKSSKKSPMLITSSPQDESSLLESCPFVDRYRPRSIKQIIGQQGERSCVNKLLKWLRMWNRWHLAKTEQKKKGFGANDDGSIFRCALLSGPPGIGKTTSAKLCCEELGIKFVEFNASDTRNKKTLENRVMETIASHNVSEYFSGQKPRRSKDDLPTHALIMDEVDGMSGNEDRAGIAELITLIKQTKIPIICICNDRHAQKIRTLANYCFDLRFHRPQVAQIKGAMMSIAFKEKLKISSRYLEQMIESTNHDIRQVLYQFSILNPDVNYDNEFNMAKKDLTTNIFDVTRVILTDNEEKRAMNWNQKCELFFTDYNAVPLFVHENYLNVEIKNVKTISEKSAAIASTAESIAFGDIIERKIRSSNDWSLLNDQAIFSVVIPTEMLKGYLKGQIQFPQWFGKNSKQNRAQRLLQELRSHTSLKTSCNAASFTLDYLPALRQRLLRPLLDDDSSTAAAKGVNTVLGVLTGYNLTKEDMDNVMELSQFPNTRDSMNNVLSKVKSSLTRAYNKHRPVLPYATGENISTITGGSGKRKKGNAASTAIAKIIHKADENDEVEDELAEERAVDVELIDDEL